MSNEQQSPYIWKGGEKFELTGQEFEFLINATRAHLSSAEAQKTITFLQMNDILNRVMEDGIKSGKIFRESDAPPQEASSGANTEG